MTDGIDRIVDFVCDTGLSDMDETTLKAARTFILDTLGVGIGGSTGPMATELLSVLQSTGPGDGARVWATGGTLTPWAAAQCNAYQAHCQEFDCVHEPAVAHVMTIVLPVAMAHADRVAGISGARLVEAVVIGVEVASALGLASEKGLRFFRPATVGAFGGVAAMGKLMGFDRERLLQAFSLAYGQLCGTMQAHTEGSGLLAMQVGFNARNAVQACDFAAAGFTGPRNILEGPFGYYTLFEDGGDLSPVLAVLGDPWHITEIAHKPFPSGRATHGILDGCMKLQRQHGFSASEIASARLSVPPLIEHLVGRPPKTEMQINYARLCARYVTACALHGRLDRDDFTADAYTRADRQALANRFEMTVRTGDDPNALAPIGIAIDLNDGRTLTTEVQHVYGCPENPMTREAQVEKVRMNISHAAAPLADEAADRLIDAVGGILDLEDVRDLSTLISGGRA